MGRLLSFFFFLSGSTGLIYEVVWAKYLALALGNTAHAHTVVLGTLLGGLALGNALFGPWADRVRNRLLVYGVLEVGIGLLALASPYLLLRLSDIYVLLARESSVVPAEILRVALSAAVLLPPTILMGGTLPVLVRLATRSLGLLEGAVSWLYFVNSAGAVLGTLLAGFYLIPYFGLEKSIAIPAFVNVAIGLVCILCRVRQTSMAVPELPRTDTAQVGRRRLWIVYAAVLVSGAISLTYEIVWIRLLSLVLGSSTYSFSIMLAAFIAGIALGSGLIASGFFLRVSSYLLFGLVQILIGLAIIVTLPFYERLPYWFGNIAFVLNPTPTTFYLFETFKLLFCFGLMLVPTTFIGMTLPLASRVVTSSVQEVGKRVGSVFSINAVGNVVGAAVAGLLLLPLLGIQRLIEAGVVVNLLLGLIVIGTASQWGRRYQLIAALCTALVAVSYVFGLGNWDQRIITSGEYRAREAHTYPSYRAYLKAFEEETLLYYKDDESMTVTVSKVEDGQDIQLKVNGKVDATAAGDLPTQTLLGQLPLLLKPDARDVLLIGLGSGITAGSVLRHPIERLDVAEISGAVVEAERFFRPFNHSPLEDPRLELYLDDAKTMLKLTPRHYDIIISEPSNPWIAGIGSLFTVDFYREAQSHLRDGGLMVQWFHLYEMTEDNLRLIIRTFSSVFKEVSMWDIGLDVVLVGSTKPIEIDFARMAEAFHQAAIRKELRRIGVTELATLLSLHMASDETVRRVGGKGPLNTDLMPVLEYAAPMAFYLNATPELAEEYDERWFPRKNPSDLLSVYLESRGRPASREELRDMVGFHQKIESNIADTLVVEWARRFPEDPHALLALARLRIGNDELESARRTIDRLLELEPHNLEYLKLAGDTESDLFWENQNYLTSVLPERALDYYQRLLDLGAKNPAAVKIKLAKLYEYVHEYRKALELLDAAARDLVRDPEDEPTLEEVLLAGAKVARQLKDRKLAVSYARRALGVDPNSSEAQQIIADLSGEGVPELTNRDKD